MEQGFSWYHFVVYGLWFVQATEGQFGLDEGSGGSGLGSEDLTVTCTTHYIQVDLLRATYSYLNPYDLHLLDNTCKANGVNTTHVTFKVPLDACGTTHVTEADKIVYSNQVSGKVATEDLITRNYDTDFTFKCKYDRSAILSVGALSPKRKTVITADDAAGDYKFILHMFKSELFKTAYTAAEFPVSADLGQRLFFQVKVATNDTNLVLFIDYCKATPGKDRNNKNYYSIIHDGCGKDDTLQYSYDIQATKQRFSFEAFRFVGDTNDIYIHCSVQVCRKDNSNSRCASGCLQQSRRRRDEDEDEDGKKTDKASNKGAVSIGPLIFKEESKGSSPKDITPIWVSSILGILVLAICCTVLVCYRLKIFKERKRKHSDRSSTTDDGFAWISFDDMVLTGSRLELTHL